MSLKRTLIIFGAAFTAVAVIIGMSFLTDESSQKSFQGGVNANQMQQNVPNSGANMFDTVPPMEADKRATANRTRAEEAIQETAAQSYMAEPVISLEGVSGDAEDPMADAFVGSKAKTAELQRIEGLDPIQKREAPNVAYRVPETEPEPQETVEATPVQPAYDPALIDMLRSSIPSQSTPTIVNDTYDRQQEEGAVPMHMQTFEGGDASNAAGTVLPSDFNAPTYPGSMQRAEPIDPEPVKEMPQSAETSPESQSDRRNPIATIGPRSSLDDLGGFASDAGVRQAAKRMAANFDLRWGDRTTGQDGGFEPYRVAQSSHIGTDGVGRIYDSARDGTAHDGPGVVVIPGDMMYATLLYGFNSDDAQQMPVFAELHDYSNSGASGFLNGSRLKGTLQLATESAAIQFDQLIFHDGRPPVDISAIAVSPDLLRTGVFADVNRHRLSRYASLFVAGLFKGAGDVGQAIIEGKYGTGGDGSIIIVDGDADEREIVEAKKGEIILGTLGPVGDNLTQAAQDGFSRPPTVSAPAGFGMGIVFLEPVTYEAIQ